MTGGSYFSVLFALTAVLAVLGAVLALVRRLQRGAQSRSPLAMSVLHRLPLGNRQALAAVRIGGRIVVVSVAEGDVKLIMELAAEDSAALLAEPTAAAPALKMLPARPARLPRSVRRRVEREVAAGQAPPPEASERSAAAPRKRPAAKMTARKKGAPRTAAAREAAPREKAPREKAPREKAPREKAPPEVAPRKATMTVAMERPTFVQALRIAARRSGIALPLSIVALLLLAPTRARAQAADSAASASVSAAQATLPVLPPLPAVIAPTPAAPNGSSNATPIPAPQTIAPRAAGRPIMPPELRAPRAASPGATATAPATTPQFDVRMGGTTAGDGLHLSGPVGTVLMMGLLTTLPTLVLLMTSFTRILIVLQFLRQAIGTQTAPPAQLIGAFALLLTGFVMAPTMKRANNTALQPWLEGKIDQVEMLRRGALPFRDFMLRQTRDRDLEVFVAMSDAPTVRRVDEVSLPVLTSAFVTSELRTAFQIGFVLFLPFIIIDIVVAAVLMSMGMFMLPPAMISLPFKLLLFVLVDGWTLIVQSLVSSFH